MFGWDIQELGIRGSSRKRRSDRYLNGALLFESLLSEWASRNTACTAGFGVPEIIMTVGVERADSADPGQGEVSLREPSCCCQRAGSQLWGQHTEYGMGERHHVFHRLLHAGFCRRFLSLPLPPDPPPPQLLRLSTKPGEEDTFGVSGRVCFCLFRPSVATQSQIS